MNLYVRTYVKKENIEQKLYINQIYSSIRISTKHPNLILCQEVKLYNFFTVKATTTSM